jgi:nitroreductase
MPSELTPTDDPAEVECRLSMPLVEAVTTQRAVRRVLPDPVDPAIVRRCIELALDRPTGSNGQTREEADARAERIWPCSRAARRKVSYPVGTVGACP